MGGNHESHYLSLSKDSLLYSAIWPAWRQQILSPNASLQPHSAKGARGFCGLIWCLGVALITVEFTKDYLRGLGTMRSWAPSSAWALSSASCRSSLLTNAGGLPAARTAHLAAERQAGPSPFKSLKKTKNRCSSLILDCTPWPPLDQGQVSWENWAGRDQGAL